MQKIEQPIVNYEIVKDLSEESQAVVPVEEKVKMAREEVLSGQTYKVKTPLTDHALYITINDDSEGNPYEIFLNSKNMQDYQWIVALTRVVSASFRNGEAELMVHELKSVFDPNGGYWKQGTWVPSLVAEIGGIIERHMQKGESKAVEKKVQTGVQCPKCGQMTLKKEGGCEDCLNCDYSKCG